MDKSAIILQNINDSIATKNKLLNDKKIATSIEDVANAIIECYQHDGKVLFCGNGGSAADAQHLAAELTGRYYYDRPPLYAEALHVNTSYLTAVANDYNYNEVYARLIKGIGRKGDILIGMSTSGNSQNVIGAIHAAKDKGIFTIGLTGSNGGKMNDLCDINIAVPSNDTPRIQECHMMIGHAFCQVVETSLFPNK